MNTHAARAPAMGALFATTMLCATAAAQRYVLSELPPNSPFGALAWDINDAGTAVGDNLTATLQRHAIVWGPAGPTDLTPTNPLAQAQGISEGGLVAGWMQHAGATEATRWTNGQATRLGWLPGHVGSLAQDVNDAGLVAGWSVTPVGDPVAAIWNNGQIQAIGGWQSWAFAVSETGDVVGRRWVGVDIEAFRWRGGLVTTLADLGPNRASAVGISPAGRASGSAEAPGGVLHAVVWEPDGTLVDLGPFTSPFGTFPAQANDVNDAGIAVGSALIDPVNETFFAMVWRGAGAEDLNFLIQPGAGWTLFDAQAVNARGEIVGIGLRGGFSGVRAFRLRPDCDGDGLSDLDEIAAGTEYDSNQDGLADACQHCQADLGFQGAGLVRLSVCGDPLTRAGNAATIGVSGAVPSAAAALVVSLTNQPRPVLGGVLVPGDPWFLIAGLVAGGDGRLALPVQALGPVVVTFFAQAVALDGATAQFSNAVQVEFGL